jgi:hypothetical protein
MRMVRPVAGLGRKGTMSGKRLFYERPVLIGFHTLTAWGACKQGGGDSGCATGSGDAGLCGSGSHAGSCANGPQATYGCNPTGNSASGGCQTGPSATMACNPGSSGFVWPCGFGVGR